MYDTYTSMGVAANPFEKKKGPNKPGAIQEEPIQLTPEYYVSIEIYL